MSQSQDPPEEPSIKRFKIFLKKNELSWGINEPKFVCINAVKIYLAGKKNDCRPLNELLNAIFKGADKPDSKTIFRKHAAMLCILIMLGKGVYIYDFVSGNLHDGRLPLDVKFLPESFPLYTGNGKFYDEFCDKQWMFCVPDFTKNFTMKLSKDTILPITKKTRLNTGGSAEVFEIQIHPCYNKFLDDSQSNLLKECDLMDETSNTFVLKTYTTPDAQEDYETETKAYEKLHAALQADRRHIVTYYGKFTHMDTYNIIIERADIGSLEKYFKEYPPPSESEDIHNFWENLFGILNALHGIHYIEEDVNKTLSMSKGWHQDVKPANILVFSNKKDSCYEYMFKLADFGNSHFKKTAECGIRGTDTDSYGTLTYGAPECYRPNGWDKSPLEVKQKVDIWSFGCILSEAAVWLCKGYKDLQTYRQGRQEHNPKNHLEDSPLGTCFHDGDKVLDIVLRWHKMVQGCVRNSDIITVEVLKMVENEMLFGNPESRSSPRTLAVRHAPLFGRPKKSTPHNSSEAQSNFDSTPSHRIAPLPYSASSASSSVQNSSKENIPSHQETTSQLSLASKHLQEEYETTERCESILNRVKNILSLLSEAERRLDEGDPKTAHKHYKQAREVINEIINEPGSKNARKMLQGVIRAQHYNIWAGSAKCELDMMGQVGPPLSIEQKKEHLRKAKGYSYNACKGQDHTNPAICTLCGVLRLVNRREQEIYFPGSARRPSENTLHSCNS